MYLKLKNICMSIGIAAIAFIAVESGELTNLLSDAPYTDLGVGKKVRVDEKHLFLAQVALKPGKGTPQHKSDSHVHIIVLEGEIVVNLAGKDVKVKKGDLLPIEFDISMNIKNKSTSNATFIIIKTPNPKEMKSGK